MSACPNCGMSADDWTVARAARALGVTTRTIQRMVHRGELVAIGTPSQGRETLLDGASVRELLDQRRAPSGRP